MEFGIFVQAHLPRQRMEQVGPDAEHQALMNEVDHVKVAEGLGCKALRVQRPDELLPSFEEAKKLLAEFRVPVVVEVILERVTNISMGTDLDNVVEFEELAVSPDQAPTAIALLD